MNELASYTTWEEFISWAQKYGWLRLKFVLRKDKTAYASFILPSGKYADVECSDDTIDRQFVVTNCVIRDVC